MVEATEADLKAVLWPGDRPVPTKTITCRHCQRGNRVEVPTALFALDKAECGACGKKLFLGRDEPLTQISSNAYEHALDRRSLEALKAVPGFTTAVRWLMSSLTDRSARLTFLSTYIRCGDDQFPELVAVLDRARAMLDIQYRPQFFLGESPHMNAMATGVDEPLIAVHAALLDQLDDTEVLAVLGHELGHIHADHTLYRMLAFLVLIGGPMVGGVMKLVMLPLQKAFFFWTRCAELTCDRAGLLCTRDFAASLRVLLKLAGSHRPGIAQRTGQLRLAPFVRQAMELKELEAGTWMDTLLAMVLTMNDSHPAAAWRVLHLVRWVESGNYLDIMAGDYRRVVR